MPNTDIRPFRVDIPQDALDDLDARLRGARWPHELPGSADVYGVPVARVRELVAHWLDGFDWRAVEARLNT
ncbi:MAG: Microsomal epoxide hydrolase, partial [Pseudonocardia sp.]|nr:Microsomal epoxide hydrolase [Pseudonocardia sp.]